MKLLFYVSDTLRLKANPKTHTQKCWHFFLFSFFFLRNNVTCLWPEFFVPTNYFRLKKNSVNNNEVEKKLKFHCEFTRSIPLVRGKSILEVY